MATTELADDRLMDTGRRPPVLAEHGKLQTSLEHD